MASKCEHCGELALDDEDQICHACGIVIDDIQFGSEITQSRPSFFRQCNRLRSKSKNSKLPYGYSYGVDVLNNLSHLYNISSERRAETLSVFKQIYGFRGYKRKEDIGIVAGCCLLHIEKKYNHFICITDLCHKLRCTKRELFRLQKFFRNWYESTQQVKVEDSCDNSQLHEELPESAVSLIPVLLAHYQNEDKEQLISKTKKLVHLAYSCWLFTGRSPQSVVVASAYLCWKSMDPTRKRAPFTKFCSSFSIRNSQARLRIPELKTFLLKLGCKIPSYTKDYVTEDNVLFHLDYILENSESLRNDLLEDIDEEEAINCKEFASFRRPARKLYRPEVESNVEYPPDMCASDIEISDTEISSYLRSDEQKAFIQKLMVEHEM